MTDGIYYEPYVQSTPYTWVKCTLVSIYMCLKFYHDDRACMVIKVVRCLLFLSCKLASICMTPCHFVVNQNFMKEALHLCT